MLPVSDFTVGNTITIAVAIYRNNLKKFLRLSFVAHLWLLVPIYGWARYFAIAVWISRLSLQELSDEKPSISKKKFFSIFSLGIYLLTAVFNTIVLFVPSFIITLVAFVIGIILFEWLLSPLFLNFDLINKEGIEIILGLVVIFISNLLGIWFYTFTFTSNAIVSSKNIFALISRSFEIGRKNSLKIFKIICLLFAIALPLWSLCYFLSALVCSVLLTIIKYITLIDLFELEETTLGIFLIFTWFISMNLLTMPLWQSAKSIVYYESTAKLNNYNLKRNRS